LQPAFVAEVAKGTTSMPMTSMLWTSFSINRSTSSSDMIGQRFSILNTFEFI
jgi:hypothetical protein